LDYLQRNVASLPSATGQGYVTVVVDAGQPGCPNVDPLTTPQLSAVQTFTEGALGDDPDFQYPLGLVSFHLNCAGPVQVKVIFYGGTGLQPPLSIYRKYGHMAPNFGGAQVFYSLLAGAPNFVSITPDTIGVNPVIVVRYTLQDGLLGDDGPPGDSAIRDPAGLASPGPSLAPALSHWGLAVLVVMLGGIAALALRRRVRAGSRSS